MFLFKKITPSMLFSLIIFTLLVPPIAYSIDSTSKEVNWKVFRNENNIIGFERNLPNAKFIETKSETILNYPIDRLIEVLDDPKSYSQWMYRCTEAQRLNHSSDQSRLLYFVQSAPLGSSDRQVILRTITHRANDKTIITTVESIMQDNQLLPPDITLEDRVWMVNYKGEWLLSSIDSDRTKISYTAHTDPGGFSPAFIVNNEIRNVTFKTLQGMIQYLNGQQVD